MRTLPSVTSERAYSYGADQGIITLATGESYPWHGLVSVKVDTNEETSRRYFEGLPLPILIRPNSITGEITAYSIPDVLTDARHNGLSTKRKPPRFDFCYREKTAAEYRLHILYNVRLTPGEIVNEQKEPTGFSASFFTRPSPVNRMRPAAHLIIDVSVLDPTARVEIEERIYGGIDFVPRIPSINEIISFLPVTSFLIVTDLGNGLFEIEASDDILVLLSDHEFEIDHPLVQLLPNHEYTVESA